MRHSFKDNDTLAAGWLAPVGHRALGRVLRRRVRRGKGPARRRRAR